MNSAQENKMSVRANRGPMGPTQMASSPEHVVQLQRDLQELRAVNAAVVAAASQAGESPDAAEALSLSDLNETERSAASLGVSPDSWKPIGWLNQGHYDVLRKKNVLAGPLAQRIEAYRQIALADEQVM